MCLLLPAFLFNLLLRGFFVFFYHINKQKQVMVKKEILLMM